MKASGRRYPLVNPEDWPAFVELPYFRARWEKLGLADDELRDLQIMLAQDPEAGKVMRETGGLRKVRYVPPSWRRGKSGALRIGYVWFPEFQTLALLEAFAKADKENVSAAQRAQIRKGMTSLRQWVAEQHRRVPSR